jgi:uncharacterized protein (DUF433 family)
MKPEYDFSAGIRGKFYERYRRGWIMEVFPGILIDPAVRFGRACIAGTRVDVATVLGAMAAGDGVDTISTEFALSQEQIRSALAYAAHVLGQPARPPAAE